MRPPVWYRGGLDADLDQLVRREVDDLAKFHLIRFLRQAGGDGVDARSLARSLGFHSIAQTEAKLTELVACGLVSARWEPVAGLWRYALSSEPAARRRLSKLWRFVHNEACFASLLRHLAERSIESAQVYYGSAE